MRLYSPQKNNEGRNTESQQLWSLELAKRNAEKMGMEFSTPSYKKKNIKLKLSRIPSIHFRKSETHGL